MSQPSKDIREKYIIVNFVNTVKELHDNHNIISFITETYFYSQLWCLLSVFYISLIALILHFFLVVSIYMILSYIFWHWIAYDVLMCH